MRFAFFGAYPLWKRFALEKAKANRNPNKKYGGSCRFGAAVVLFECSTTER